MVVHPIPKTFFLPGQPGWRYQKLPEDSVRMLKRVHPSEVASHRVATDVELLKAERFSEGLDHVEIIVDRRLIKIEYYTLLSGRCRHPKAVKGIHLELLGQPLENFVEDGASCSIAMHQHQWRVRILATCDHMQIGSLAIVQRDIFQEYVLVDAHAWEGRVRREFGKDYLRTGEASSRLCGAC